MKTEADPRSKPAPWIRSGTRMVRLRSASRVGREKPSGEPLFCILVGGFVSSVVVIAFCR